MLTSDRILALDIGASKVILAEFSGAKTGSLQLERYGIAPLGLEPEREEESSAYIVSAIRDTMRDHKIRPAPVVMTVSGQAVFPRYVKLPPVSRDKVSQIISYEAEQNVPFPINEVVWDYELIGGSEEGELNAMLVAVKIENVRRLTDCVQAAGLEPLIVDVAPMALYNTVRYNYPDLEGCTMVLDVGARCTNLIFIEENRIFSRSIPVAGNAVTTELMKEFEIPYAEAEDLKLQHAFVAFGGVYAGPDNEVADRVSKIVRNVITRLHAEVNRSINFYRSQQGGGAPSLILLTGGSSIIPHTDTFFREKLNAEVEYLNPFANVAVGSEIDADAIQSDIHVLGEVVGLALRKALTCPIEMNLMPPDLVARKRFRRRQPFFAVSAIGIVLIMLCWWLYFYRMSGMLDTRVKKVEDRIGELDSINRDLTQVRRQKAKQREKITQLTDLISMRTQWAEVLEAIHASLLEGMWLTSVTPIEEEPGVISKIEFSGMGFEDKLREIDQPDKPAIEIFRDRLRAATYFTGNEQGTRIKFSPPTGPGAFAREFTMVVELETPIVAP